MVHLILMGETQSKSGNAVPIESNITLEEMETLQTIFKNGPTVETLQTLSVMRSAKLNSPHLAQG